MIHIFSIKSTAIPPHHNPSWDQLQLAHTTSLTKRETYKSSFVAFIVEDGDVDRYAFILKDRWQTIKESRGFVSYDEFIRRYNRMSKFPSPRDCPEVDRQWINVPV